MISLRISSAVGLVLVLLCASVDAQVLQRRPDGPKADELGRTRGYPACLEALQRPECRVGAWSGQSPDELRAPVARAARPSPLPDHPSPPKITWRWGLFEQSVDDFLDMTQTTGLLILKDGQVVAERYQYDRQPDMPLRSFSMAKTVTSMLVGIAQARGFIRSLDEPVGAYWPEISQTPYGQTTLRNLLRMSSGMPFRELYTWTPDDDNWVWGRVLMSPENRGRPERVEEYLRSRTVRETEQGQRFRYASIETELLGRVLARATGQSIAQLTQAWLWKPLGAEYDAYWNVSSTDGVERTAGGFNASLRDWGRFGALLALDGTYDGQEIIPSAYLLEATDISRQPTAFRPRLATPTLGYGYQVWLLPNAERTFVLQGIHGQSIFVQPAQRIVMVQTSVNDAASGRQAVRPYQIRDAFWDGVLRSLRSDRRDSVTNQ